MTKVTIFNNPGTKSDIPLVTTWKPIWKFWNQLGRTEIFNTSIQTNITISLSASFSLR